jgi:hypothetical protein
MKFPNLSFFSTAFESPPVRVPDCLRAAGGDQELMRTRGVRSPRRPCAASTNWRSMSIIWSAVRYGVGCWYELRRRSTEGRSSVNRAS